MKSFVLPTSIEAAVKLIESNRDWLVQQKDLFKNDPQDAVSTIFLDLLQSKDQDYKVNIFLMDKVLPLLRMPDHVRSILLQLLEEMDSDSSVVIFVPDETDELKIEEPIGNGVYRIWGEDLFGDYDGGVFDLFREYILDSEKGDEQHHFLSQLPLQLITLSASESEVLITDPIEVVEQILKSLEEIPLSNMRPRGARPEGAYDWRDHYSNNLKQ